MSQVVDLGYVVGPTGPKGSDAILPETEKMRVYVAASPFENTEKFDVKYVKNHSVVTEEVPTIAEDDNLDQAAYTKYIECDFGSVVYFTNNDDSIPITASCAELELSYGVYYLNYSNYTLCSNVRHSNWAALVPVDNLYVWVTHLQL